MDQENIIIAFLREHKWQVICTLIAFFFSLFVIYFGFWRTVFISVCVFIGCWLGRKLDSELDISGALHDLLHKRK